MSDRDWSLILVLLGGGILLIGVYDRPDVFGWVCLAVGVMGNIGSRQ